MFTLILDIDLQAVINHSPTQTSQYINHDPDPTQTTSLQQNNNVPSVDAVPDARQNSQLSMIAASASEMVPQDGGLTLDSDVGNSYSSTHSEDALGGMLRKLLATNSSEQDASADYMISQPIQESDPDTQRAALYPRPIAMNPNPQNQGFINGFGEIGNQTAKHKTRSQFSEERRKEVQLVRKMGACLRCRMLKKTVSLQAPVTKENQILVVFTAKWYLTDAQLL